MTILYTWLMLFCIGFVLILFRSDKARIHKDIMYMFNKYDTLGGFFLNVIVLSFTLPLSIPFSINHLINNK